MNKNTSRHSSLFLLELIAAIFFFCLAGAVCIRFFVKSHTLSQDTRSLDMAVNQASSVAELFQAEDDFSAALLKYYPDVEISGDNTIFTIYYDEKFSLTVTLKEKEEFILASIQVLQRSDNKEIYTLQTEKYISGKGGLS